MSRDDSALDRILGAAFADGYARGCADTWRRALVVGVAGTLLVLAAGWWLLGPLLP